MLSFKILLPSKQTPKDLTEKLQHRIVPPSTTTGNENLDVLPKATQCDLDALNCKNKTLATSKQLSSIRCSPTIDGLKRMMPSAYSGVFRIWQGGHGERAEREPITGVWGRSPQRGPGAEPLVGGSGGEAR